MHGRKNIKLEDISLQERNLVHNENRRPMWQWRHNIQLRKTRRMRCNL